jgi:3-oxoadipate enol-lactonase
MKVSVGNVNIYYESHGDGYPLILIRGLGSNADHWYEQVPVLSKAYRVITFDNRGVARSGDSGDDFSILDMALDTLGLMDVLGIKKSHIMGLSMGGMIAQELAINYPERIDLLILACTHCGGPHQVSASAESRALFTDMIYLASPEVKMKAAACLFDPNTLEKRPDVAGKYSEISLRHPVDAKLLTRQWEAALKHDTYDRLPQIKAPTLVLTGDADLLVPPENTRILAERIPGAIQKVIPGGGHQVLVEQPEACNEAILQFLRDYGA